MNTLHTPMNSLVFITGETAAGKSSLSGAYQGMVTDMGTALASIYNALPTDEQPKTIFEWFTEIGNRRYNTAASDALVAQTISSAVLQSTTSLHETNPSRNLIIVGNRSMRGIHGMAAILGNSMSFNHRSLFWIEAPEEERIERYTLRERKKRYERTSQGNSESEDVPEPDFVSKFLDKASRDKSMGILSVQAAIQAKNAGAFDTQILYNSEGNQLEIRAQLGEYARAHTSLFTSI